jgi:transcriptional regulator with XRE-family HTH domain
VTRSLARLVRESRQQLHLTQVELARRCRVSRSEIAEIEAGRITSPRAPVAARLSEALGIPLVGIVAAAGYVLGEPGVIEEEELSALAASLIALAGSERTWLRERLLELRDLLAARRSAAPGRRGS